MQTKNNRKSEKRGPSSFAIGFMIGIPLAVLCIALIAIGADSHYQSQPAKPMKEAVYDRPAYTANAKAPSDIDFMDGDIEFVTGGKATVVTPKLVKPSEQNEGKTANGGYSAEPYRSVYVDDATAPASGRSSDADSSDADSDQISESQDTERDTGTSCRQETDIQPAVSGDTGSAFVERTGNDISDQIWKDDSVTTYNSFTQLDTVADVAGKLGSVSIPSIGLTANIYKSDIDEMEAMKNGVAHFNLTSSWDGNVGLCAHNWTESGNGAYFKELNQVRKGDTVTYTTSLGTRTYTVSSVATIDENDWSYLNRTDDNRITLVTCTFNDSSKRLCVQAVAA